RTGEVREVGLARRAVPGDEPRQADVDRSRVPVLRHSDRRGQVAGNAQAADEVLARSAREHGEVDTTCPPTRHEAVHALVHRTVTADDDEELRAVDRRAGGELAEVPGRLGDQRIAAQPLRRRLPRDLRPPPPSRPVGRGRVDEEDDVSAQCFALAVAVASATRVIRSTALRSSSSVIRVKTPSTTMSLTVNRQPAWTPRIAPTVNSAAASISTPRTPRFDHRSYWPSSGL